MFGRKGNGLCGRAGSAKPRPWGYRRCLWGLGAAELSRTDDRELHRRLREQAGIGVRAFLDLHRIVVKDRRRDYGEDRYPLLEIVDGRAYVVVYTTRGSAIRINSARKANRKEVADFEHNERQD